MRFRFFAVCLAAFACMPSLRGRDARDVVLPSPRPLPPPVVRAARLAAEETPPVVEAYSAEVRVAGLFATVKTLLTVRNPNLRVFEGELEFPLPEGASVCGYALDVNGVMTDGVVVKKEKARAAFEAEVKLGADPGLVEHLKGNAYRTRVYPLPARGVRRIRVDYVAPLAFNAAGDAALVLPMPRTPLKERAVSIAVPIDGLPAPKLGGLGDNRFARAEAVWRSTVVEKDLTPEADVVVSVPAPPARLASVERRGSECWFALSAQVGAVAAARRNAPLTWRVLWDASGSRTARDVEQARAVLEKLPENGCYELIVFRDAPEKPLVCSSRAELLERIAAAPRDGGTDFSALAAALRAQPTENPTLLFTDGLDSLSDGVADLGNGCAPVAFVSGGAKDLEGVRALAGGRAYDLDLVKPAEALDLILAPRPVLERVKGAGIANVVGVGQRADGRVTVLGRLEGDSAEVTLDFGSAAAPVSFTVRRADALEGVTLATAWASRRVTTLTPRADDNAEELLAIGRRYGIVSPVTSMIVFERLDQWLKYDVEPPETAVELRAAWEKRRPNAAIRAQEEERARERHLADLKREWQARVAWWENPVPKAATPKSGLFDADEDNGVFNGLRRGVRRLARAASSAMPGFKGADSSELAVAAMAAAGAAPACAEEAVAPNRPAAAKRKSGPERRPAAAVKLQAWDPKTPYLDAIKDAAKALGDVTGAASYGAYLEQRAKYAASPAFYLDCAGWFFAAKHPARARRILSNLAELRLEDASLLRAYAWRLYEAGEYAPAVRLLRKVAKMRGEEAHAWRDLALVLAEKGKAENSVPDLEEAMALYAKVAFTPWKRANAAGTTGLFALEELNALTVWCERREWKDGVRPKIPEFDAAYRQNLDLDVRISMAWDADDTDVDLHVLEPSGEEVFYGHKRSASGGLVSYDVTTGYGPEEFLHRKAPAGEYKVLTHYFGSSQQKLTGPATVTATVYLNWGRADETRRTLSLRLDRPKDKVSIGSVEVK